MKGWLKALAAVIAGLVAIALLIILFLQMRGEREREAETEKPVKLPSRVVQGRDGEIAVKLDEETLSRAALRVEPLAGDALAQEAEAYGRFEEDPSMTFTLRSPVGGTLRRSGERDWPALGQKIAEGADVGVIDPRLGPAERADLAARLSAARAEAESASAALVAARAALERARILNAEGKSVSDRVLQETEARLKAEEARERAAKETMRVLEPALAERTGDSIGLPLAVPRAGEVVEVAAQPGEAVEGGQVILRLARFDRILARVALPAGVRLEGPAASVRALALGYEDRPLRAEPLARAGASAQMPGETFLLRVEAADLPLRPGMALKAMIGLPGEARNGVIIPRSAIVRFAGRAWAYVQVAQGEFSRREVVGSQPVEKGWFVCEGFTPGEIVVTAGAQVLLSEELKSQIQVGEEEQRKG